MKRLNPSRRRRAVTAPAHSPKLVSRQVRAAVEALEVRLVLSTIVVNTFVDQTDPPTSTTISLRDAIALAASTPGDDTINLPAGTYPLTSRLPFTDTTAAVTVDAIGGTATLAGDNNGILGVDVGAGATVTLSGITITEGTNITGGALSNAGTLTINNGAITNSSAEGSGAGIQNGGTLNINDSTISGNASYDGPGGGLYNSGTATLTGVTFSGNMSQLDAGGAIGNSGTLTIIDSTISGNKASAGGAISNSGTLDVYDSTIDGNSNGINTSSATTIANTIIADNDVFEDEGLQGSDITGAVTSHGGNFISETDGSSGWIASDQTGTSASPIDPKLTVFGNYGGATQTYVPLAGSPVLAAGLVNQIPAGTTADQRGLARVVSGAVDIGAVEEQASPLITVTPPSVQTFNAGTTPTIKLGSISDPGGSGPFIVEVTWGDNTPDTIFTQATAGALPSMSHSYGRIANFSGEIAVTDSEGDLSNLGALRVDIVALPQRNVVVNTTKDQIDPAGSKTVSLADAIALTGGPVAITFDPKVFATNQTITLVNTDLELANSFGPVSITGPAAGLTITSNFNGDIFVVDAGVTANITGLTITGNLSNGNAGTGITNFGNLTAKRIQIFNEYQGIDNNDQLMLTDSTISGNVAAGGSGAGLANNGVASIFNTTFSNNAAYQGYRGSGGLTVGGGIENTGMLTLTNSTLSGNSAEYGGGGLYNSGTATVSNSTITGASGYNGGAIDNAGAGTLTIANSIVSGDTKPVNTTYNDSDAAGVITSLGHNLVGFTYGSSGWVASDLKGTPAKPLDPKLSPLGNYGGPSPTQFPLAASPAIGAGSVALIPSGAPQDQRGFARVVGGKLDIGSVELQKTTVVTVAAPAAQTVVAGVATAINIGSFTDPSGKAPFTVEVNWGDGSPVSTYSYANAGKLGTHTHAFINTGSLTATVVVIDASGDVSQFGSFGITSSVAPKATITVNTTKDQVDAATSTTVSLRDAINRAAASFGPVTIAFSSSVFATAQTVTLLQSLGQTLVLNHDHFGSITITGPSAGVTMAGALEIDLITVNISNFSVQGGGVVNNNGTVTITNGVISKASTPKGGIDNEGTLTLTNVTVTGNNAFQIDGGRGGPELGAGGGIYNDGILTIINSTISGNTADANAGGIENQGKLSISGSTISGNKATYQGYNARGEGGGIDNENGTITISNSTISGNAALYGAGINNGYQGAITITDSTIAGNTATDGAGGIDNGNGKIVTISNTIIASNVGSPSIPDVTGKFTSLGHNLIGKNNHSTGWISTDLTGSISHPLDAKLSPLANHGGPTLTIIPLAGSPALQAGSVSLIPAGVTTDQRGLPRVIGGKVDIGAVELNQAGPYTGTPAVFGRIQAENFDLGGQYVGYYNPGNVNSGGLYRPTEGVSIGAIPSASGGGFDVGSTQVGEYLNYTVTVAATGTYTLNFRVSSATGGGLFHLNVDGVNVTGSLTIPKTGSLNTYQVVSKTGVKLTAGTHVVQLVMDKNSTGATTVGNFDYFEAVKT